MEYSSSQTKTAAFRLIRMAVVFCSLFIFLGGFFAHVSPALAQSQADVNSPANTGLGVIQQPLGLPSTDIRLIIANVIRVALGLLGTIFLVLVIYAGYLWMTAGGNDEQIASAKKILINASIGLAIILLAYAIVSYVMSLFAKSGLAGENGGGGVSDTNFAGAGALGQIIKDHYPARDQVDVARNTKIIITFRKPIKMSSVALDSNQSAKYGDCVNIGQQMVWKRDCDQVILDISHINITRTDTGAPIEGASILAAPDETGKVYTIVLRPFDPIGDSKMKVPYQVHIGKDIVVDDSLNQNVSIFAGRAQGSDFYEWQFTASTELDNTPPHVVDVFPTDGATEAKNSIIQVSFNEAVDPTGVQGSFANGTDFFTLSGGTIFLKTGASTVPLGTMRLVNGYRTLEFTPSKECGTNACGGKIYCLSVCDAANANCQVDTFTMLLKAAQTFSLTSFEGVPFSGIMDVSGNALDGNNNGKVDAVANAVNVFPDMVKPDNYFWSFGISNTLDVTEPFISSVTPGIDATFVNATDTLGVSFTKVMRFEPFYDIKIDEKPAAKVPLCFVPGIASLGGPTSIVLNHCPFLDKDKHLYYPSLDSNIEDAHFNCLYPGKGPIGNDVRNRSLVCSDAHPENCCAVTTGANARATCCNGVPTSNNSASACINSL